MRTPAVAFAALLMLLLLGTRAHGMLCLLHAWPSPPLVRAPCEVYPPWTDLTMHISSLFLQAGIRLDRQLHEAINSKVSSVYIYHTHELI